MIGDLGVAKKYCSLTLTSIAAKIYNALLLNRIKTESEKILRKKMVFGETDPQHHIFWHSVKS